MLSGGVICLVRFNVLTMKVDPAVTEILPSVLE